MINYEDIIQALESLVDACTPEDAQPNDRGELRSVRTPEWKTVDACRRLLKGLKEQ